MTRGRFSPYGEAEIRYPAPLRLWFRVLLRAKAFLHPSNPVRDRPVQQ